MATVLVGGLEGAVSPARRDTDHFGVDVVLQHGETTLPLRPEHEHAIIVAEGAVAIGERVVEPGHLAYLGLGHDECRLSVREPARALLLGGTPFEEEILMWWNYVARTEDEVTAAHDAWLARSDRFPGFTSSLDRIEPSPPPWVRR